MFSVFTFSTLDQGQQTFSVKGHAVTSFSFEGHTASVKTIHSAFVAWKQP